MSEPDLSHLLLTAFRSLDAEIGRGLQDRGISDLRPSQAAALLLVDRAGTRLTELAHRAVITKQAMMQIVDELESLGCIRRLPDDAGSSFAGRAPLRGPPHDADRPDASPRVIGRGRAASITAIGRTVAQCPREPRSHHTAERG